MKESTDKKVHFVSLGCPKNLVDSEIMLGSLLKDGYTLSDDEAKADTIVVNTCGFIEASKKESIAKILEMAELKQSGSLKNLVVAGCLTQRYKDELVQGLPEGDLFIGSGEFPRIAQILRGREAGSTEKRFFNLPTYLQEESSPRVNSQPFWRAYLKISEGCMKRCSFCAIPKIRGNLQSRSVEAVLHEAQLLRAGGVREVNVISHDFTDYGWDLRRKNPSASDGPVELLRRLSDMDLDWIRVLYLYPDGITDELTSLVAERPNLVKYFDMPLQHINSEMLKSMNRKMTREEVIEALDKIRSAVPEAVIRTQFIVGYPGETEEQFEELLEFVEDQRFDRVGAFEYSPEEGTPGGKRVDQISDEVKSERYHRLMQLQQPISREKHRGLVGKVVPVLVEGVSEESEHLMQGRTSQQAPDIDGVVLINEGEAEPGSIVQVLITDSHDYDLVGSIVPS